MFVCSEIDHIGFDCTYCIELLGRVRWGVSSWRILIGSRDKVDTEMFRTGKVDVVVGAGRNRT